MSDQYTSYQAILRRRLQGMQLRGRDQLRLYGASPDMNLADELRNPGDDQRHGVNLLARPSEEVITLIQGIQRHLSAYEPRQYYYPANDLHLTIIQLCSGRAEEEAEQLASSIAAALPDFVSGICSPKVIQPHLISDPQACALNFVPIDQALEAVRSTFIARAREKGIIPEQRHPVMAAHITLMRYITPLRTPIDEWLDALASAPQTDNIDWHIDQLWMTSGATWYGMHNRIRVLGPYKLS